MRRPWRRCWLTAAMLGVVAAVMLATAPSANAQFNPCVRPQRPLLPIPGSVMSEAEKNGILLQFSRYFDDLSRYLRCLSAEMEDAQRESEESIAIYEQFNSSSQY